MVRMFNGKKYLSIPKDGFEISDIDDIGVVQDSTVEDLVQEKKLKSMSVVGVKHFKNCYSCLGKVTMQDENVGHCNRCGSMQLIGHCNFQLN